MRSLASVDFDEITLSSSRANSTQAVCRTTRSPAQRFQERFLMSDYFARSKRDRRACRSGQPTLICALTALVFLLIILVAVISRSCEPSTASGRRGLAYGEQAGGASPTFPPLNKRVLSDCPLDFPWSGLRLPAYAIPLHYRLLMHPNLTTFSFVGVVEITIETLTSSSLLVLNAKDMRIINVSLTSEEWIPDRKFQAKVKQAVLCARQEQLAVKLSAKMKANKRYLLALEFAGNLTDDMLGMYRSQYKATETEKSYMAVTNFQPVDARAAFPCFDEPAYKANFSVSIVRAPGLKSLANMPLYRSDLYDEWKERLLHHFETSGEEREEEVEYEHPSSTLVAYLRRESAGANLSIDQFNTSLKMSTYLVAMAVFDFPSIVDYTTSGVKVAVYAPTPQINQTQFAMSIAVDSLNWLESFFNVRYPLPKQALVAVADFAVGAMENWGMVTIRDRFLLYDTKESSTRSKHAIAEVIMHELSHQWFGNLVTMKWWNDVWLNEGFATFIEDYGVSKIRPEYQAMSQYYSDVMCNALALDGLATSHSVSATIDDPYDIVQIFDEISYDKAGSMIYVLLQFMGEERLKRGLQQYLEMYKFSTAESRDLWTVLEKHMPRFPISGLSLPEVMDSWTTQVGYPYVKLELRENRLVITQQRFLYLSSERDKPENQNLWYIPFSLRTSNPNVNLKQRLIRREKQVVLPLPKNTTDIDWIKANADQSGFYRVLYTEQHWEALTAQLLSNHSAINPLDRSGLLNDAFSFVRAGLLHLNYSLALLKYLPMEEAEGPWEVALAHLKYIESLLDDKETYLTFREFVRSILEPVYLKIGWTLASDHQRRLLQIQILTLSCHFNVGDCIDRAKMLFEHWVKTNESLTPDFRALVCSVAILHGTKAHWTHVFHEYRTTAFYPGEREDYLVSLFYTRNPYFIWRLLDMILDPSLIRPRDIPLVFGCLGANPVAKYLSWRFVQSNWNRLVELLGITTNLIGSMLKKGLSTFKTEFDLREIHDFFKDRDLGSNSQAVDQLIEEIQINIQWMQMNYDPLTDWLKNWCQNERTEICARIAAGYQTDQH